MSADGIARLKVTLDEVEPPVLRRIEVPLTIRLDRLHSALQAGVHAWDRDGGLAIFQNCVTVRKRGIF